MNDIRTIAVLGAGALGASYAAQFSGAGYTVGFVASGDRADKLESDGVFVNDTHYKLPVHRPTDSPNPVDLILVALKDHHIKAALPYLKNLVGDNTTFISVMNGLDSEQQIGALYGIEKVLYCISVAIPAQREGNRIRYSSIGRVVFGEAKNTPPSERVRAAAAVFEKSGIGVEIPPDMIRSLWWKFMLNVGINQATAVTGADYGVMQTNKHAQTLMDQLMLEVVAVATAEGVNLVEQDITDWYNLLNTLEPSGKTSMLQDVEAGRKTEVEMFAGKVMELGEKHGIPTPYNASVFHIIRTLETTRIS